MSEGIIYKALSGFYYVESENELIECRARGKFRLEGLTPLVGDRVVFNPTESGKGILTQVLPRKNEFVRPPVANIEKMVIIVSGAIPVTDPFLIDKMIAIAEKNNCEPIICINKIDLDPAKRLTEIYNAVGYTTIRVSAAKGLGLDELSCAIAGSICAFTGNSGVGKSSILNALEPDFSIEVGDVSKKLGRGRHTTRHVQLFKLRCGAVVADTPGFSAFDTNGLSDKENLHYLFSDFEDFIGSCRFLDCAHIKEPGCAVLDAIKRGAIQKSRWDSYVRLYEQAALYKEWEHR